MFSPELQEYLRHNFTVNVFEGAFFGLGLGFASTVTVVPLFVDSLTDSTVLIGLVASVQMIGWQLPGILTAGHVSRLRRYLPMVMWMTIHERWPWFALALVAVFLTTTAPTLALILTFICLCWFAIGGGFTATAWQSLIGKIMPLHRRGTFWGVQAAAASIMTAFGSVIAGQILGAVAYPVNYGICFALAGTAMMISLFFLSRTHEPEREVVLKVTEEKRPLLRVATILQNDRNFNVFLIARILTQVSWTAVAFYTIYGVREFEITPATATLLGSVLTIAETAANPFIGYFGDKWGHRRVFAFGCVAMAISAGLATFGTTTATLYFIFAFAGIAHSTFWTTAMTMTLEFSDEDERPFYIGFTNTMIAPATLFTPIIGGWIVEQYGFAITFGVAAVAAILTALILLFLVQEPRTRRKARGLAPATAGQ